MEHLLCFYGNGCPDCDTAFAYLDRLKREEGIVVTYKETWSHPENEKLRDWYDREPCGGVPFFVNTHTGETLCGVDSYESLRRWAHGEQ